jgi:transketolase
MMTIPSQLADLAPAAGDLDGRAALTLRMLAADAVETARSGHPGLPMGMATAAWVLWSRHLRFDPTDPAWPDRDRFVLSAGHGSMLLYALLHVSGYDLPLSELRRFRQWGSATPGHPEFGHTPGVETTTGPLGQGIANAVGLALAERMAAARYNAAGEEPVVDHRTFVICSDGDLMEGVSGEAASLAGHLGLGRLVVLYDDNGITIDGETHLAFTEDVGARFAAYGWHVTRVVDGEDVVALEAALAEALAEEDRPSLVPVCTTIGFGAPTKAGTAAAHGAPLGPEELAATKVRFGWTEEPFVVPPDVGAAFARLAAAGRDRRCAWEARWATWAARHPQLAADWDRALARALPEGALDALPGFEDGASLATRAASGRVLSALAERIPELVGGSADLAESTNVALPGPPVRAGDYGGRVLHFGVREHAMAAIANGLALHGGFRPVVSTFLIFSDYLRPALRLSALMGQPVVYVFTHDSVGLGEDGPTHQPVEHLAALRAVPNLAVLRPADARETAEAWAVALARTDGPTALVLSRQALPVLPPHPASTAGGPESASTAGGPESASTAGGPESASTAGGPAPHGWLAARGARVVRAGGGYPDVVIVATGSEVALSLAAADLLDETQVAARVVSMPWRERFEELDPTDQEALLPYGVPRLVVEAASPQGWREVTGDRGRIHGLRRFGASAPGSVALAGLGFSPEAVAAAALELLGLGARP